MPIVLRQFDDFLTRRRLLVISARGASAYHIPMSKSFLAVIGLTLSLGVSSLAAAAPPVLKKSVVAYPWIFTSGTDTARETAVTTMGEISQKNGYDVVDAATAKSAYADLHLPEASAMTMPTTAQLVKFGKKVGASYVVYGSVDWHTRSIWVGAGPKTISTATVSAKVLNVSTGKVTYSKNKVTGRSDEKEDTLKVIGAVLITPLVTAVSGGPKTPQEQRAVQIALARAFQNWNKQIGK